MQTVTFGNQHRGLYFLQQGFQLKRVNEQGKVSSTHIQDESKGSGVACFSNAELWHFRLGHLSFDQLKHIDSSVCNNSKIHGIC